MMTVNCEAEARGRIGRVLAASDRGSRAVELDADGARGTCEAYAQGPDGKLHFYRLVEAPLPPDGGRARTVGLVDDLTDMRLAYLRARLAVSVQEAVRDSATTRQYLVRMGHALLQNLPNLKGVAYCPARWKAHAVCLVSEGLGVVRMDRECRLARRILAEMAPGMRSSDGVRELDGLDIRYLEAREMGAPACYVLRIEADAGSEGSLVCFLDSASVLRAHGRTFAGFLRETLSAAFAQWQVHLRLLDAEHRKTEFARKARAAEQAKALFLASVSHDLRTPLNSILGFAELLRDEPDGARRSAYLDNIAYSGGILLDLVNDVLDLVRLDDRRTVFKNVPTDVPGEVAKILEILREKAERKGLALDCDMPAMPKLKMDDRLLRRVLFNLVGNAIKFTDAGRVYVSSVLEREPGGTVLLRLAVADTGIGIAPDHLEDIMQPYYRVESPGEDRGGTGLGLSICKRIAEQAGGRIEVASCPGKGSVFTVVVPGLAVCREDASCSARSGHRQDFSDMRVLVVDDIALNRMVLTRLCQRLGVGAWQVAESSEEALERMRTSSFDLVLTDKKMPGMDGCALVRAIRAEPAYAKTWVYLVTADMAGPDDVAETGADGILQKPVGIEQIRDLLAACHARRNAGPEA